MFEDLGTDVIRQRLRVTMPVFLLMVRWGTVNPTV